MSLAASRSARAAKMARGKERPNILFIMTDQQHAGIPVPEGLHGRSVRAVAEGRREVAWRDHVVAESRNSRMVRTARYKYVVYDCGERRETLVDMHADPGEMKNLALEPKLAGVLNHHRRLLANWTDRTGDRIGTRYLIRPDA